MFLEEICTFLTAIKTIDTIVIRQDLKSAWVHTVLTFRDKAAAAGAQGWDLSWPRSRDWCSPACRPFIRCDHTASEGSTSTFVSHSFDIPHDLNNNSYINRNSEVGELRTSDFWNRNLGDCSQVIGTVHRVPRVLVPLPFVRGEAIN